jgi:rhodanese-related sulfurtransferase
MAFLKLGLILLLALQASPVSRPSIAFTKNSLKAVKMNMAAGKAVLVDVRSKEEWEKRHLEGSIFLPVTSLRKHSLDVKAVAKTLPKKEEKKEPKILYTFCVVGMRAKEAGRVLEKLGYEVRVLKPGYEELVKAGFKRAEKKAEKKD